MGKIAPETASDKKQKGELVLTPGGWRPKSEVHFIESGQHISGKGGRIKIIETATGKVIKDIGKTSRKSRFSGRQIKDIGKASIKNRFEGSAPAKKPGISPALPDIAWIENSGWTNNSGQPIVNFTTKWIVPPAPAADDDQTIFLFNGLQNSSHILQPVLQWGGSAAGGGKYWSIASWYADGQGGYAITPTKGVIKVNTGDVLQGVMTLTGSSTNTAGKKQFSYKCSFVGYPDSEINATNIDELDWTCETLEAYGSDYTKPVPQCSDYPDAALTAFHEIQIQVGQSLATGTDANIAWGASTNFSDCGQKCLIVSNDSPGGDVYLYYRNVTQDLYFVTDKSTFGKDEVADVIATAGGRFPNAFWVVLEGFTIDQLSIDQPSPLTPVLSGQFNTFNGVFITPNSSGPEYELPGDLYTPQRIRFPFDIKFSSAALTSFPNSGDPPMEELLTASMTIGSVTVSAKTLFELISGADPYFTNVDPTQDNVFWLSQDLRVFTAAPAMNNTPVAGGPVFSSDSVAGAYDYIQNLLTHLNSNYNNPSGSDPFASVLPDQSGALTGDSSVTPFTLQSIFPPVLANNYNFVVARVRLRGTAGSAGKAQNVKVFFRLWSTQSADTDYQPGSTYLSNLDSKNLPASPLPATGNHTIPFFATGNNPNFSDPNNTEFGTNGVNNRTVEIVTGDSVWAYYGCFLNLYDSNNIVNGSPVQALLNGTHHCIVAQIAYDDAPIVNSNGVTMNPENCDKLAQRNLQITHSDNPGAAATHRIPQTFDLRPSLPVSKTAGALLDYPDELMIDWGNTPVGSTASIYWPQVDTAQILQLASKLYNTHLLSAPDHNTVQCKVTKGVTYVPIPTGSGQNFAGLLTVDLPPTVEKGQEFNIVIRRITTRQPQYRESVVLDRAEEPASHQKIMRNWRCVVGTFQIKIPVSTKEAILFPEENTLAILKWRLEAMSPANRWYPVLQRYISYVAARVDGLGGNSSEIKPSLQGVPVKGVHKEKHEHTGKVCEVMYDCFGDFEGFILSSCSEKHLFRSREKGIGEIVLRACKEGLLVSVWFEEGKPERICKIVIRC